MVSSDEINRRLEARRRGVKYQDPHERRMEVEPSNTKECPSCHTQNPPTAKFCVGCGEKLESPDGKGEVEKEYSPEIKGPQEATEKPIQTRHRITQRPDDFSKSQKLEPIVPPEPETPEPKPETTDLEPETPKPETETAEPKPETPVLETQEPEKETTTTPSQEIETKTETTVPLVVKKPATIPTPKPKVETIPKTETPTTEPGTSTKDPNVDPVERIKKAKELLDLGAITQEDFDKIKNKYLDEI